jgi:hypothetical protein
MIAYPISDKEHQQALCDAKRGRLQILELQAALHGISVPPHIAIEILELRSELKKSLKIVSNAIICERLRNVSKFFNLCFCVELELRTERLEPLSLVD